MRSVAASVLVIFGCTSSQPSSPTPAPMPKPVAAASASPATTRADLTRQPLPIAATIDLHGATLGNDHATDVDANGFTTVVPIATVTLAGARMDISPITPSLVDRDADAKDNAGRFKIIAERSTPSGEWARLYQWREGDQCFLTGGSPRAKLRCRSHDVKMACSAEALLDVCASIEPSGPPIAQHGDLAATFPATSDALARTTMGAVALAIMGDDRAGFERYIATSGVSMRRRGTKTATKLAARHVHAALATTSLVAFTRVTCQDYCRWSDNLGDAPDGFAAMTPNTESFGVITAFRFERQVDKTWKLVAIEDVDLGEDR